MNRKPVSIVEMWDDKHVMSFEYDEEYSITAIWFDKKPIERRDVIGYLEKFEGQVEYGALRLTVFINSITWMKKLPLRRDNDL